MRSIDLGTRRIALDSLLAFNQDKVLKKGQPLSDPEAKILARDLAYLGVGKVSPNPAVGCVILDCHGKLLTYGHHEYLGGPHAEISAINRLEDLGLGLNKNELLKGARLFVTLEPCSHTGKTGPCAVALTSYPFAEVIYAAQDSNPQVDGQGIKILRNVGIKCTLDADWGEECLLLNYPFFTRTLQKRPYFALKMATSINGYAGSRGDQRAWISGEASREYGRFLRHWYDGVAIGVETFIADNPSLSARYDKQTFATNKIVFDPKARGLEKLLCQDKDRMPPQITQTSKKILWILGDQFSPKHIDAFKKRIEKTFDFDFPFTFAAIKLDKQGRFIPEKLCEVLLKEGIYSLLLEGGSGLHRAFLESGLVDFVHHFIAPTYVSNPSGLSLFCPQGAVEKWRILNSKTYRLDSDILIEGKMEQL